MTPTDKLTTKQKYYQKNKDKILKRSLAYAASNRDKVAANERKRRETNPESCLYSAARYRAKRNGLEFNISLSDVVIPAHCPYLGLEITNIVGEGKLPTNASLDRIDNTKGYIKGNIEVISSLANVMKNAATKDQLISFAEAVLVKFN